MKPIAEKRFKGLYYHLYRFAIRKLAQGIVTYQPVPELVPSLDTGRRDCQVRWDMIRGRLKGEAVRSAVDLGCAEGFFVRASAQDFEASAIGVDGDPRRFLIASNETAQARRMGTGFIFAEINSDLVSRLPKFDLVICMSLMHHIIYGNGLEEAEKLIRQMHAICGRFLVFDMGHSKETSYQWSSLLPDMGNDPDEWISDFLTRAGFAKVEKLGQVASPKDPLGRTLFLAMP